ncbi:MAG: hypothetical protein F6K30_30675 [Cyanothece sp. SIO2G6]|nr:hypothetical protein [Cyanothece sp. SIO2G6]
MPAIAPLTPEGDRAQPTFSRTTTRGGDRFSRDEFRKIGRDRFWILESDRLLRGEEEAIALL